MTLIVKPGFNGMTDADAIAYVNAVEAADGQLLEFGVGKAINDFVVGCKLDGTWSAIKASCILAGARTLDGALVPLVGTAPTNVGGLFVSGDYNRKTGLKGDGSSKYLNSNRNNNTDPRDDNHNSVWVSETGGSTNARYLGTGTSAGDNNIIRNTANITFQIRTTGANIAISGAQTSTGFLGMSRLPSNLVTGRVGGANTSNTLSSVAPGSKNVTLFSGLGFNYSDARIAFYSIGESLNLAALDARVTALITAFGVAIP
jgi:hypothetical protein